MCGICGLAPGDALHPVSLEQLEAMASTITHRGPDDFGTHSGPGIGLASNRLAILDLSERGHMPMSTPDGRYTIVYNGEIYNFQELRGDLEARGYSFRSHTDTEVLLYLFAERGLAMLSKLNGMFAFAIWDSHDRSLTLVRDRLGVKPLYYALHNGVLYFGSEEKALFAGGVPARFDPSALPELLMFRYTAGEDTPFNGIKRLLPGHYLRWHEGRMQIHRWWNLAERAQTLSENLPRDPQPWFREMFDDSVDLRRISDVPVGVLLSGGLDSSTVACSLAEQAQSQVASFTVRFAESGYDEGPIAHQVAERHGLEYHDLAVSTATLVEELQRASWLNDEPLAHGNDIHILAISRYAKERVTVLLSGEGADETHGGYVRYRPLWYPRLLQTARPLLPLFAAVPGQSSRVRKLNAFLAMGSMDHMLLFNSCDTLPPDLESLGLDVELSFPFRRRVLEEAAGLYPGDLVRQAMYYDQHTFLCSILDRNDRMTMGAAIECRVPFLDYRLVEMLAALPTSALVDRRGSKRLIRQALGDRLPDAVLRHRKWGFGVPWAQYFRQVPPLRALVEGLPESDPIRYCIPNRQSLQELTNSFLAGDDSKAILVRQLVMLVVWYEACVSASSSRTYSVVRP